MSRKELLKSNVSTHFEFGENWAAFSESITAQSIEAAEKCLHNLLPPDRIRGRTFLDIGCGSGLHSLAAIRSGARSVTAIDIDPDSVKTCKTVLNKFAAGSEFECFEGNVFDLSFAKGKKFDIVYSWGVLHHTGSMWEAIANAASLVAPGGILIIAIYNKTRFCGFWRAEKCFFTSLPKLLRWPIIWVFSFLCFVRLLVKGINPFRHIREYREKRGMSWYRDRIDWLGGYPYESASAQEITEFVGRRGGRLKKAFGTDPGFGLFGSGCAEYVFDMRTEA